MAQTPTASLTPRPRSLLRRWGFWIVIAVVLIVAAIIVTIIQSAGSVQAGPLDPRSPAPDGTKALVSVLAQQGVDVTIADTFDAATAALDDRSTLVVHDPLGFVDTQRADRLADQSSLVVLIDPDEALLDTFAPGVTVASQPGDDATASPSCTLATPRRAGTITTTGTAYASGGNAATDCYPDADGAGSSLIQLKDSRGTTIVLGATAALTNEQITDNGNAALALGLLGSRDRLVWYEPGFQDVGAGEVDTLGSLSPDWVVPVMLLGVAVFLAAAIWRGRRFGPLVAETLPVVVRSTETMEGRARLYERSGARSRALDALRIGTVTRMARALGLPRSAGVEDVARAGADLIGWRYDRVLGLLLTDEPENEAALGAAAAQLSDFEAAVRSAVHSDTMRQDGQGQG